MSTELVERQGGPEAFDVGEAWAKAELAFPAERKAQVAQFLSIDADNPAFEPFLAVSAALGLNPILGEIWLIPVSNRMKDANNNWVDGPKKYRPAVGRDGLLAKARRDTSFVDFQYDVVHAEDTFEMGDEDPEAKTLKKQVGITHKYGHPKDRGVITGAWCIVKLRGRAPQWYYADLNEHGRTKENRNTGAKSWDGAWGYTSTMILKAAQSYVLRMALGVTGIVPIDELTDEDEPKDANYVEVGDAADASIWDDLGEQLQNDGALYRRLVEITAEWPAARVEMELAGRNTEELAEWAQKHSGEEVADAEVVEEQAAAEPGPDKLDENADAEPEDPAVGEDEALDEKGQDPDPKEAPLQGRVEDPDLDLAILGERLEDLREKVSAGDLTDDQEAEADAEIQQLEERIDALTNAQPGDADGQEQINF